MYARQPILTTIAAFATNAVANTNSVHTILAAPGAGVAYRVVGANVLLPQNEPAANVFRLSLRDERGSYLWTWILSTPNRGSDGFWLPEPGVQHPVNNPLRVDSWCTVVTRTFQIVVYYFRDDVT